MITADTDAIALMVNRFDAAWTAGATAIVGIIPDIRWPGVIEPDVPPANVPFARWSHQNVIQEQQTLRNGISRRYHTRGNIFVQIFTPIRSLAQSLDKCEKLAMLARDSYMGKRDSSMTYHYCRVQQLEADGKYHRRNAVIEYRYDFER